MEGSEPLIATAFDSLPMEGAILDATGDIVYTNRAWREFAESNGLAGSPGAIGVNYLEVTEGSEGEAAATAAEGIRSVMRGEREVFAFEYPCHSPTEERWFTMRASRFEHGGDAYVLVLHLDITERRLAERESERRAERLENVARLLSHDLRNPLSVAQGYANQLVEGTESPPADDPAGRPLSALDRMEQIVTDALVFARHDGVEETRVVDLRDAAERAWRHVETGEATLTVDGSLSFEADPDLLAHVFENLFRNAVEHADDDARVEVGALADREGFYVADDGPGVPDGEREAVFDVSYTTGGTGLGLAIVVRVADLHGWEITVTEAASGGARFEVTGVETVP